MKGFSKLFIAMSALIFISMLAGTGASVTGQISEYADRDTYVSTILATQNYGASTELRAGNNESGDLWDAFLHFDLSSKPAGVITTRFHFYVTTLDSAANLSVWRVQNAWNEDTLTFASGKPAKLSFVQYLYIPTTGDYAVDVTTLASPLSEIAFGINSSVMPTGNVVILSSEYTGAGGYSNPRITWTYEATTTPPAVPGFETWFLLGSAAVAIGITIKARALKRR